MDFLLDDWNREESRKMAGREINNTKLPCVKDAGINRLYVAACNKLKTQPSCQQSYNLKHPDAVCYITELLAHPSPAVKLALLIHSAFTSVACFFSSSGITFQGNSALKSNWLFPDICESVFLKELCSLNHSSLKIFLPCLKKRTFFSFCIHDYCRSLWLWLWGLLVGLLVTECLSGILFFSQT